MKLRTGEHEKYEKQFKFQDVRLRVAHDVLGEYQNDKAEKQNMLEKASTEHKALEEEVNKLQTDGDKSKGDTKSCQGDLVSRNIYPALLGSHIPFVSLLFLREERASAPPVEEHRCTQVHSENQVYPPDSGLYATTKLKLISYITVQNISL